jgi:hypothetical protein
LLPRRIGSGLEDRFPVRLMTLPSAVLSMALGFFLGFRGFLAYAAGVAESSVQLTDEIGFSMSVSALSLFLFALTTPAGLLATYLFLIGALRAIAAVAGDLRGDPLLSLADSLVDTRRKREAAARAIAARAALEGPELPDVLEHGEPAGFPDAEWVVIASRLKPGWEKGVFVVTPDRWYRILRQIDRPTPEGLKAVYLLGSVGQAEVLRRSVAYEHPQLSALHDDASLASEMAKE